MKLDENEKNNIQTVQKRLLKLLKTIHDCCIENDIQYSLHGGTLLGAVREKGFIPWDDDADISMNRSNYNKLVRLLSDENNKYGLYITHFNQVTQVVSRESADSWIDVFVYDYISGNHILQRIRIALLVFLSVCVKPRGALKIRKAVLKHSLFVRLGYDAVYFLSGLIPYDMRVKARERVAEHFLCGNRTLIHKSNDQLKGIVEVFPKKLMEEYVAIPFEDTALLAMRDYETVLITSYGKNYMEPVRYMDDSVRVHESIREYIRGSK